MEILICEVTKSDTEEKGFNISFIGRNGKKQTNESDFFPDGSEIETKIQQLKRLLRQHFDANP